MPKENIIRKFIKNVESNYKKYKRKVIMTI